jgi:hypothetical protein
MIKWFAAAAAIVCATPAMAADWYLVSTASTNASAIFVDKDSIADAAAGATRSSIYTVLSSDDSKGAAAYRYTLDFNCSANQYSFVHLTVFDATGKTIADQAGSGKPHPVVAGSQFESMEQFTCSHGMAPTDSKAWGPDMSVSRGRAMLTAKASGN